jgi:microbial collagenase
MVFSTSSAFVYASNLENSKNFNIEIRDYSLKELNQMDLDTLIETLTKIEWNNVIGLSDFDQHTINFYSNQDRMDRILNEIEKRASLFTKDDDLGLQTLIEVYRLVFYHAFYHKDSEIGIYDNFEMKQNCDNAINSILKNPNFKLGTKTQDTIVKTTGLFISNTYSSVRNLELLSDLINDYESNLDLYQDDREKNAAIYNVLSGVEYSIKSYVYYNLRQEPSESIYFAKFDSYLDAVSNIVFNHETNENIDYIINNAFYELSYLGKFHSNESFGNQVLTFVMDNYDSNSMQYIQAAERISNDYDSIDYNGQTVDFNLIKEDAKDYYLPNEYYFDNNRITIKAGADVAQEKIKRLYFASKEVSAQVFRAIKSDKLLDSNTDEDILNIVIYNSPKEYDMNRLLYGYSTDNGGIYIDPDNTFFTYERTPSESIYTLEELFRHEFTHHLQGQYIVPGLWGQGDFYSNGGLNWYDEGSAEFFAGSTRYEGVKPRASMVSGFAYNESNWYDANKTLHSVYGSFEFYKYAFSMIDYMHKNYTTFEYLTDCIKRDDFNAYNNYINTLSSDYNFNEGYRLNMKKLSNQYKNGELEIPLVSDIYLEQHEEKPINEIKSDIVSLVNLNNIKIEKNISDYFETFTLKGEYTLYENLSSVDEFNKMNEILDNALIQLDEKSWTGYQTFTAYFANPRTINNQRIYDIVFHGILNDPNFDSNVEEPDEDENTPIGKVTKEIFNNQLENYSLIESNSKAIYKFEVENDNQDVDILVQKFSDTNLNWVLYKASDFNNYVSYAKFEDNKLYNNIKLNKGIYYLSIYKYNDNSELNIETLITGIKKSADDNSNNEDENNDGSSFEKALNINLDETKSNSISNNKKFIYELNITDEKQIYIEVNSSNKLNWLIYKEDNLNQYDGYASDITDTKVSGNYNALAGKYYIVVYELDGDNSNFDITIN